MKKNILVVGLNAVIQKTIILPFFKEDAVIRANRYRVDAAGKATNVCRVLTQLGQNTACLTPVGIPNRQEFMDLAKSDNLTIIPVKNPVRIRNCYTLISQETGSATEVIVDEPELIEPQVETETLQIFTQALKESDVLIITGSKAKGFSEKIIPEMVKHAKEKGIIVFADYRGADLKNSFYSKQIRPDYIKINQDELKLTFPEFFKDLNQNHLEKSLDSLVKEYGNTYIITNGDQDTIYSSPDESGRCIPKMVKAINHVGCGDTFLAGLVDGILKRQTLKVSIDTAGNLAAKNALSLRPGDIWQAQDDKMNV
ncbi:MAG: PfkB family carbohydrate kinase [Spirochaetes bacterium]|nr:PfkB family carbohydrate kinase [Spirochaetota bacterium]